MATVLVPWRGGCPHRERALNWVADRWFDLQLDLDWRNCWMPDGPWSKGAAIGPEVASADSIVIVADADCWTEGIPAAVAAVEAGADWAVPHKTVHRLTEKSTAYLLAGCTEPVALETERCEVNGDGPYNAIHGGGIVVVRRDVLLEVPFDPRFTGWGGEDTSWRDAMLTLVGEPWRGREPLFHLWHPPQERMNRFIGSPENHVLRTRYVRANRRPKAMRALLAEIDDLKGTCGSSPQERPARSRGARRASGQSRSARASG
jgi:hypothetical protein